MNTRSQKKNSEPEAGRDRDDKYDALIRPSIRNPKRSNSKVAETDDDDDGNKTKTIQNKMVADVGERTQTKARFSVGVASKSRNKNNLNSSKPAAANAIIRENGSNHSGKESDDEDESSEEGLEPTRFSKDVSEPRDIKPNRYDSIEKKEFSHKQTSIKAKARELDAYSDGNFHEQGDQHRPLSRRQRKDVSEPRDIKPNRYDSIEKKEFSHKQTPKKAKARELDTYNSAAYSDGEDNQPQTSTRGAEKQPKPQPVRGSLWLMSFALIVIVLGVWILVLKNPSTPSAEEKQLQVMKSFQDNFRKLPILFSGQSSDLWHRSQRILELQLRHVNENKEPAIILLTAAQDAKQMLYCVGNHLAKTYASALNSSYTVLSGTDMPSEDSEDVKMDIDHRLNAGFQGNSKAAVLHHLESLPPGSLIILYKYCDHENAAFKNVALVLTVLLKDPTLHKDIGLNELEETVYDFLKETFINQAKSKTSHNEMDGDKLGGVWSRISHVVLPVFPGKQIVKECEDFKASP